MEKKNKDILKLSRLVKHWADHNASRKESFLKWRDNAKNNGLDSIVDKLNKAIELMDESTKYLLQSHDELA